MKEITYCPICKSGSCVELSKKVIEYPGSDLCSNLLNINYIRNSIMFDKILKRKEPVIFRFEICSSCGFIFFTPRPEEKDIIIKYSMVNELGDVKEREGKKYIKTCDDKRAFKIYRALFQIRKIQNSNVVDIGGAQGLNLKYFLSDNNVCFVVDYEKRKLIHGAKYLGETAESIPDDMHFEVVLYCHILEHTVDPVKEILKIKEVLKPNGLLYIEVPFECSSYQYLGNFLTHINFFSTASLWNLLNICDFKIRYLRLKPTLTRTNYSAVIVAIAEKVSPLILHNKRIDGYSVTLKQMKGKQYFFKIYLKFLNAWIRTAARRERPFE